MIPMNVEDVRAYTLLKENVTEGFPFGENVLVFKIDNKIFLLMALDEAELRMNVKCDPEKALEWREEFPDHVLPGYHMNKKHWNTIIVEGLKTNFVKQMIDDSYQLVAKKKK
jgi:predicted DNA-binding protein (MmcQ/YjbR family)